MPTATKPLGPAFVAVAQGPGEAVFSFNDSYGSFSIHTAADPAGIVAWHKQPPETPFTLTLAFGEYLHLRGRGTASVSAATIVG